ncbi:hypothetical protein B6U91_00345 [Candidatus Pacearchaeota archaeon ex4484_71]|nr:MAG: hypothetical protein B6U91_00345 [Candidatus Pacearchaeota archaeon ex4484_71]
MPTKIFPYYVSWGGEIPEKLKKEFYCSESPREVLNNLSQRFLIHRYKDLNVTFPYIPERLKKDTKSILFGGIGIEEIDTERTGLSVNRGLEELTLNFPEANLSYKEKEEIIHRMILENFIDTEILGGGYLLEGPGRRTIDEKPDKQRAINYFKTRKKRKDEEKEREIIQAIEYSSAILGREIGLKTLERMSRKVEKSVPKEVDPVRVVFATLVPSKYRKGTMFWQD